VIFEVAPPLLLLALKRGAIKGIKDPEQLFEAKGTKIVWEDWAMEQPIFLRGQVGGHPGCETGIVMRSPGITDMLQTAARRIGLGASFEIIHPRKLTRPQISKPTTFVAISGTKSKKTTARPGRKRGWGILPIQIHM
jgi:hypothetical protein